MSNWVPLSVRRGIKPPNQIEEGVPQHLAPALEYWVEGIFGYRSSRGMNRDLIHNAALAVRIPVVNGDGSAMMHHLLSQCLQNGDLFLDVIDYLLSTSVGNSGAPHLEQSLSIGGSAWMAARDLGGLRRRVDETAQRSYDVATSPTDQASDELKQAWDRAFSRDPDASDAWDHAIKAVEAALIPIVVPKQDKAQLGHVVGSLRSQGDRWNFILPGVKMDHSVQPLISMLDALWPNPDRHANGTQRKPTLDEAQSAVHLAVSLVQWARGTVLTLRTTQ
ncbi:hypothetical protein OG223_25755 [Streptomyces sp. NBC_01478]|uniref:hypothetical protein n=1 Tax=Streptomyces sp. NBC_01478 TaxID=2903882 RepID=UPI002E352217|nr:hypothetical protein [Streptomyces sp. NBC_01478]